MMDYTQLYKLLGAATCSYADHDFDFEPYYPSANDDAIRDMAVSFIVNNSKELKKIPKEKLFAGLCAVSDKKFLNLKNRLVSTFGHDFCQTYWEKGRDINLNTTDGVYVIYDRSNSMTDTEYEHFFYSLVFKPNWDFIYDILTFNFMGKPYEEEPAIFECRSQKRNPEEYKYYIREGLHWIGCLWKAGGSQWSGVSRSKYTYNINKKIGISYANDTYFWSWQQMVKKSDGQPSNWPIYEDSDNGERYWKYVEWYIKYFLSHPVKKPKDIFEHVRVDWYQGYEGSMLNMIISIPYYSHRDDNPLKIYVGLNDLAKRKMKMVLQFVEKKYAGENFLTEFRNKLYYNEDKGIIIYSKDDATAERIRNICSR